MEGSEGPDFRTRVMTHCAWVPLEWLDAARETLAGLAERHPSRSIILVPEPDADDGLDAEVRLQCFAIEGVKEQVCSEVIELHLRGARAEAPASIVLPLLVADLPAFLRWRGRPAFGTAPFDGLVQVVDRLIVDSIEWPDLPGAYGELAPTFERTAVSDIAWARTSRWRRQLASLWPGIAEVKRIKVEGTVAQAHLLAGWFRSRLRRRIELEHAPAERLLGVEVDGEPAPFPPGDRPPPSELLSDELETYGRDRIYEDAVRAAAQG
jgi:glucose-6-phosphate dehydrogenase assembly protein OpcA